MVNNGRMFTLRFLRSMGMTQDLNWLKHKQHHIFNDYFPRND